MLVVDYDVRVEFVSLKSIIMFMNIISFYLNLISLVDTMRALYVVTKFK